ISRELDILGLEIAVNDRLLVRGLERLRDLSRDRQRLVDRDRAARNPIRERLALDQFEYERMSLTAVFETVDRGNVRMVERGEHLRLALEACEAIGIERERVGDDLQRDVATKLHVACAVDLPHAAGADGREDLIWAEAASGCESHCYLVGTRRFSSSSKCWTTITLGGEAVESPPGALIIRKR